MKANEVPDKIYLQVCGDCNVNDCENCKFKDLEDNITWCRDKIFEKDIEYIRTDAFIEKVEEYIYEQLNEGRIECGDIEKVIKDFKNYMEGE